MKKIVALLAVAGSLLFAGCSALLTGSDGNVYLTTTNNYGYGQYAVIGTTPVIDGTKYSINPGTYRLKYVLAYYSYGTYYYQSNTNYPGTYTGVYYNSSVGDDGSNAAYQLLVNGYFTYADFSVSANSGSFLKDGDDRNYTLYLGWGGSSALYYKGVSLSAKTITSSADKTIYTFDSGADTITLSVNKTPAASGKVVGPLETMPASAYSSSRSIN